MRELPDAARDPREWRAAAEELLQRAERAAPLLAVEPWWRYAALGRAGTPEGQSLLERAIKRSPGVAFLHEMLGLEHLGLGDFEPAIAQLTKAIALQPDCAIAYNLRGACLSDQGARLDDAVCDLDRAIELDPSVALAWSNRAKTRRRQRRFEEALHDIDYALRLAPGHADSALFRMTILLDLERHTDLIAAADELLSRKASPNALINRGAAKLHLGDLDGALADLDAGLARSPLEDGFFFRGRVHLARLALNAAERDFKILLDNGVSEPRRSECVAFLAEIQARRGGGPTSRDERPWWKKLLS